MNDYLLQNLRYLLQKRFRLVKSAPHHRYNATLRRFWNYLKNDQNFSPILANILNDDATKQNFENWINNNGGYETSTFEEHARFSAQFLEYIYKEESSVHSLSSKLEINGNYQDLVDHVTEEFVTPVYEYLDESLDSNVAFLSILQRYKQKVEMFTKEELVEKIANYIENTEDKSKRVEEKILMPNLYEYLHDQGLNIYKEVQTTTGHVDFINDATSKHPFASDGKIFDNKNKNLEYLKTGLNQVSTYCDELGRNIGYFIIFNTSNHHVELTGIKNDISFPYILKNGKTIFLTIIHLDQGTKSASKITEKSIFKLDFS
jgi:hypothetical protein